MSCKMLWTNMPEKASQSPRVILSDKIAVPDVDEDTDDEGKDAAEGSMVLDGMASATGAMDIADDLDDTL